MALDWFWNNLFHFRILRKTNWLASQPGHHHHVCSPHLPVWYNVTLPTLDPWWDCVLGYWYRMFLSTGGNSVLVGFGCCSIWIPCARLSSKKIGSLMLKELDPLLHSQLRLGVISLLLSVESA